MLRYGYVCSWNFKQYYSGEHHLRSCPPLPVLAELEGLGKDYERTDSARVSVGAK